MQAELLDTGSLARSIEAVLFVASESLSIKALAKLTGVDEADVTVALQQIDADYAERGIVLREVAGGYRFATSPAARAVVEAYLMPPKTNLSPAALETLAIVAYMQPVTKGDIEGIRGVSADSVLSTLVDRRFLSEAGRKDVAGRPILYKTTPDFLEAFGLRSLEELPPIDIDADAPIELAFPVPIGPSQAASETDAAPDTEAAPGSHAAVSQAADAVTDDTVHAVSSDAAEPFGAATPSTLPDDVELSAVQAIAATSNEAEPSDPASFAASSDEAEPMVVTRSSAGPDGADHNGRAAEQTAAEVASAVGSHAEIEPPVVPVERGEHAAAPARHHDESENVLVP